VQQSGHLRIDGRAQTARRFTGGAKGNSRLTAAAGAALIVLLAVEGATIPFLRPLLTVHVFVGMLLLGPVALKLASTGYRFLAYYRHRREYVEQGPPAPLMRLLVAPVLVLSTLTLFGTGVALIAFGPGGGAILGLHKASFVVWLGATAIHVLGYARRAAHDAFADWRNRLGGAGLRTALLLGALATGIVVAVLTLPLAGAWTLWQSMH
jgi:hypothetical protein